jgi:type I restriction enzyme M protein
VRTDAGSQWPLAIPLRSTASHLARKQNQLRRADLGEFVTGYAPGKPRDSRAEGERFKSFTCNQLLARDKVNLDITWLRDDSLGDVDNLPAPEVIAREIVDDLTTALAEFEAVALPLGSSVNKPPDGGAVTTGAAQYPSDWARQSLPGCA